jgi:hypothetical protein
MVTLEPGETMLKTGPVRWVGREGERAGVLTLTNHALIFEGPVPQFPPGSGMGPGPMRRRAWAAQRGGPPWFRAPYASRCGAVGERRRSPVLRGATLGSSSCVEASS